MPSVNRNEKATCSYWEQVLAKRIYHVTKNLVLEVQKHVPYVPTFTARRKRTSITTLPPSMQCHIQMDGQSAQVVKIFSQLMLVAETQKI